MTEIKLRSDVKVDLIESMGTDETIVRAARASTGNDLVTLEKTQGLISYLMREGHTSPFEHCVLTFRIEAPIFVAREWERHRTQSYSELSLRFAEAVPEFYIEPPERPLVNEGSGAHPKLVAGNDAQYLTNITASEHSYLTAWEAYTIKVAAGIAHEAARKVLPLATYTTFWATANLNNWFKFLGLRNGDKGAPQWEIVQGAKQVEAAIAEQFPQAYKAWKSTYDSD